MTLDGDISIIFFFYIRRRQVSVAVDLVVQGDTCNVEIMISSPMI